MSREGMERFSEFMANNQECQEKVKSFGGDLDALAAYAAELGYDISAAELQEYQDKALQSIKGRIQKIQQSEASLSPGVKDFYKLIELSDKNEEVAKRLAELGTGTPEELIAYGKEKGFIFDKQDMKSVANEIIEPKDELSEEELEQVAGGVVLAFLMAGAAVAGFAIASAGAAAVLVTMFVGEF